MTLARDAPADSATANVAELLRDVTATQPGKAALIGHDGRVRATYADLTERAAQIAAGLVGHGLAPGGRVAVLVRDPESALVLAIAALWAGGTLVVPPRAGGWREAVGAAATAQPTVVVADPLAWLAAATRRELRTAPIRVTVGSLRLRGLLSSGDLEAAGRTARPMTLEPVVRPVDAPALVSWSTGSTGRPHPVVRSHGVLVAQHEAIRRLRTPRPDDVDLVGLPTLALHDLACGTAMALPPRRPAGLDPARLRTIAGATGATLAAGFPTLFERLVDGAAPNSLPSLRSIHVGGAPVGRALLERLALVAPNADVVVVYGSTEVEPIAAIHASELLASEAAPGSGLLVGRIQDGLELRLAPPIGGGAHAADGASPPVRGRILVRGARVARGGDRTNADGWLDTGDVGALDVDDRLWLLGRASNGSAGGRYPAEIEEPTLALNGVGAAALVMVAGRARPRPVLVVEPASAASPIEVVRERVVTEARDRGWALDRIVVVRRLPRDEASGKLDYPRIRALVR